MRRRASAIVASPIVSALILIAFSAMPPGSWASIPSLERADWMWSSIPVLKWYADQFDTPVTVSALVSDHAGLEWFNPRPDGPTAVREHDLNPLLTSEEGGDNIRRVLEWRVKPATGETGFDSEDWAGLTQTISSTGIDSTVSQYIYIWINDFTYLHNSTTATLRIDLGRFSEDAFWSRTEPPNHQLDTEDKNFDGKLQVGDPLGFEFEDTGLDGIVSALEPGYDPNTNPDPSGDDYRYDVQNDPDDYSDVDNFENNGLGSPFARPETEDLDHDSLLDLENAYFESAIDLSDTMFVVVDVQRDYGGHPNVGSDNGWRLFRIPLSPEAFRSVGSAPWDSVRQLRLWIGDMSRPLMLQIGGIQIEGLTSPPAVDRVALYQNRPNPFNPATTIPYELEKDGPVRLSVFDVHGRLVRELLDGVAVGGQHWVTWNGTDQDGRAVASGVYLYQIDADGKQEARRMVLAR